MDQNEKTALQRVSIQKLVAKTQAVSADMQKLLNEPESKAYQSAVRGIMLEAVQDMDRVFPPK